MSPADHIARLQVPWALFSSKWFICLYSEVLHTLHYITLQYCIVLYCTRRCCPWRPFLGSGTSSSTRAARSVELSTNILEVFTLQSAKQLKPLCVQVLFRVALGLLRLHEARLVARTEFSALATELGLVTRSATSLRCHAFMQEVCGNTGSLPRARVNKLKATSSSLSRHSWFQLTDVLPGEVRCGGEG